MSQKTRFIRFRQRQPRPVSGRRPALYVLMAGLAFFLTVQFAGWNPGPAAQQQSNPPAPQPSETAQRLSKEPPESAEMMRMGGIFTNRCASCHHDTADGHGPWAHSIPPPGPANLTMIRDAPDMMQSIILSGVPGTMMPSHPDLDSATINGIAAYVGTKPKNTKIQWEMPWSVVNTQDPELGGKLYVTYCSGCHGENADGKSNFAQNNLVWPKPANLLARNSDIGRVYYIITEGRRGTMMSAQVRKLPENTRWVLAQYVTGLFDATSKATIEVPKGQVPVVKNRYLPGDQKIADQGKELYNYYCSPCHSGHAEGSYQAPMLCDRTWYIGNGTDTALMAILQEGVPGKLMISTVPDMTDEERWKLITYIRYRGGLPDPMIEATQGKMPPDVQTKPPIKKGASR